MSSVAVHIVILNWNGIKDTFECLDSLSVLTYPNIRVHVIDNNSSNDEAKQIAERFPEINVIALDENKGFCGGCNVGMEAALKEGADFVMLLNNDTIVTDSLIDDLLKGYEKLKSPGAVSPLILKYPETEKIWFSRATWESNWKTGEARFRLTDIEDAASFSETEPYESEFACGCCLLVSREVIDEVGLFDERYFAFFDEAEWCARMRRAGRPSYVVPTAKIYHKVGKSVPNLVMTYLMSRNRMLLLSENMDVQIRVRSYGAIFKDVLWHVMNLVNLLPVRKRFAERNYSRAVIRGLRDYFLRKFGKWDAGAEKIIFNKSS